MKTRLAVLILAVAIVAIPGCGSSEPTPSAPAAAAPAGPPGKASKTTYICHMGADCGKADVAAGEKVPSCCGRVMVKAESYICSCGKTRIVDASKPAPECCGAAMKKVQP